MGSGNGAGAYEVQTRKKSLRFPGNRAELDRESGKVTRLRASREHDRELVGGVRRHVHRRRPNHDLSRADHVDFTQTYDLRERLRTRELGFKREQNHPLEIGEFGKGPRLVLPVVVFCRRRPVLPHPEDVVGDGPAESRCQVHYKGGGADRNDLVLGC